MPGFDELKTADEVLSSSGLSDKLVVIISGATGQSPSPDELVSAAEQLVGRIQEELESHISGIDAGISERDMLAIYEEIINNLPILLDSNELSKLGSRLDAAYIDSTIREGYKRVASPTGMVWRNAFLNDPLNLAAPVLSSLTQFREGNELQLYSNHYMDPSRSVAFLFVRTRFPAGETARNTKLLKELDRLIERFEANSGHQYKVRYYGAIPVASGNARQIKRDIHITVNIALFILSVFFACYFKDIIAFFIVFIPAVVGAFASISILSLFQTDVSLISLGIGSVLLGITVDYSLHILLHLKERKNPRTMLNDLARPIMMSSLTTAAAFTCLLIIQTKAIRDLGLFAAMSVTFAAISALLFLPLLYRWKKSTPTDRHQIDPISWIANLNPHQSAIWLGLIVAMTVCMLFFMKRTVFTSDMDKLNYMSREMRNAEAIMYEYSLMDEASIYGITRGTNVQQLADKNLGLIKKLDSLKAIDLITSYQTVQPFILSEEEKKSRLTAWRSFWNKERLTALQADIGAVSDELKIKNSAFSAFYERLTVNSNFPLDYHLSLLKNKLLEGFLIDQSGEIFAINIISVPPDKVDETIAQLNGLEGVTPVNLRNSANSYVKYLKRDLHLLTWITFFVVFAILLLVFGRFEIAGLVIIPIVISWIWTIGLAGLLKIELNIVNIIIITFVFGLGVDYAIFLAHGMLMRYNKGLDMMKDYKRGILLSFLTTLTGLGALIFAKHPALKSISMLSIIGILSAVIVTGSLIPFLFNKLLTGRPMSGRRPYTLWIFLSTSFAYFYFAVGCFILTIVILVFKITPTSTKVKKSWYHTIMYGFVYSLVYIMFNIRKKIIHKPPGNQGPVIYIANHQSFLDILLSIIIQPKIIILTNNWVWNSPFFGRVVRYADFYPVASGVEKSVEHLSSLVQDGYSIMIFPEGTRSSEGRIARFKKGAFYLAEQLNLDIVPVLIHGTGDCIRKNDLLIASGAMTMKFLDPIKPTDLSWGTGYRERSKSISNYFKSEYKRLKDRVENPEYFKEILMSNYLFKGTVLPHYVRIKLKLAGNFDVINNLIAGDARVCDLGCGYGYLALLLDLFSKDRQIIGIDHDPEKIEIATNCYTGKGSIKFINADVRSVEIPESDIIILYDLLHYLTREEQLNLLNRCMKSLSDSGKIIIRDGEPDDPKHHRTKLSEWFSTHFGFNKMSNQELCFLSFNEIRDLAEDSGFEFSTLETSKTTSNKLMILNNSCTPSI